MLPVIWAAGRTVIGHAETERGAINVAARKVYIGSTTAERWTASRQRRLDGREAWFVGRQLVTR